MVTSIEFEGVTYNFVTPLPVGSDSSWPGYLDTPASPPPSPVVDNADEDEITTTVNGTWLVRQRRWTPNIEWGRAQTPDDMYLIVVDFGAIPGWASSSTTDNDAPVPYVDVYLKSDDWDTGDDFRFTRHPYPGDKGPEWGSDEIFPTFRIAPGWPIGTTTRKIIPVQMEPLAGSYGVGHSFDQLEAIVNNDQANLVDLIEWGVFFPDLTPPPLPTGIRAGAVEYGLVQRFPPFRR